MTAVPSQFLAPWTVLAPRPARLAIRVLLLACLAVSPALGQVETESSLDAADTGASRSLDAVDTGRSLSPEDLPDTGSATPDIVGAGTEATDDGESLDAADTGASETPDAVQAGAARAPQAPPEPLGPPPPIHDGDYEAQATAAERRVAQARSNLDYWEHAYADMIRRDYPVGAERVALLQARERAAADLASAQRHASQLAQQAAAAGQ